MSSLSPALARRLAPCREAIAANAVWIAALAAFVALWQLGKPLARWAFDYPRAYEIPLRGWIGSFMRWLIDEASFGLFTFTDLTRFIAAVIHVPYKIALSVLSTGFLQGQGSDAVQLVPPLVGHHPSGEIWLESPRLTGDKRVNMLALRDAIDPHLKKVTV